MFAGEFDQMSGSVARTPIGGVVPIPANAPIIGPAMTANFPAANYQLYMYPWTTCSWTITLVPNN
jgi:hypothetical protein